jgi:hypothetical protein
MCMKRVLRWVLRAAWLACWVPGLAFANDSEFGGAGADLVPLSEQQVEMRSEDIRLSAGGDEWSVEASYVFFNTADAPVKVQVGFPEFRCESDEGIDCAGVAFRGLETRVNGEPVKHRQGKLGKKHGWADFLGVVWLFDVTFPPGEPVNVQHRYRLKSGGNVSGDSFTSYVTRTGRSWKGPIGHAKFTCVLPPYVRAVYDYSVKGLTLRPPRVIQNDGKPRLELVVEGDNWKPEGGVGFAYNEYQSLEPIAARKRNGTLAEPHRFAPPCDPKDDPSEAQRCLNELYASKGYPFKSEALRRKYYAGDPNFTKHEVDDSVMWLRDPAPLESFSLAWFLASEARDIQTWSQVVAQAKSAPVGSELNPLPTPEPAEGAAPAAAPGPAGVAPSGTREPAAAAAERQSSAEPVAPAPPPPAPPAPAAPPPPPAPAAAAPASAGCRIVPGADTVPEHGAAMLVACASVSFARAALLRRRRRCPRKTP